MKITELVEALDLPETRVAHGAWDQGRRRVRRRHGAVAGGAVALAMTCVAGVVAVTGRHHDAEPSPAPPPSRTVEPRTTPVVQRLWLHGRWRSEVSDMDFGRFPGSAAPPSLSSDPVERATLAINDPGDPARVLVFGEDGQWRQVDVPGLVPARHSPGYTDPVLRPTSLARCDPAGASPAAVARGRGPDRRNEPPPPGRQPIQRRRDMGGRLPCAGVGHVEPAGSVDAFLADRPEGRLGPTFVVPAVDCVPG